MKHAVLRSGALAVSLLICSSFPAAAAEVAKAPFAPPADSSIPDGPVGEAIRYGYKVLSETQTYAKDYVGNGLNCTSCHLDGGRAPNAGPWVGVWGVFPEYRTRNAKMNSLQDRVNDCFERSMNGKALPNESKEMQGILGYMWWLSQGVPTGASVEGRGFKRIKAEREPDEAIGKTLFAAKCAACHGVDGQGQRGPKGEYLYPALWGNQSFNIGAGMARLNTAAPFIKWNMPRGQGGSLSDQEAYDIAAYFTRQPRPDLADKHNDWPKGDKPKDARY
jgi:thiosulfate dehydrogenase